MSFSAGVIIKPVTEAAELSFEPMQQIFAFWQERGNGKLPSRADFLIEEFLPWARHGEAGRISGPVFSYHGQQDHD